jgi:hypothetical protein
MSVSLTVSKTRGGSQVADTLAGGSSGLDLGSVTNGAYTPITLQSANTGTQSVFVRHDATVDAITAVATYVAQYSGTYGGANSAAADFTTLTGQGAASAQLTANNAAGTEQGLKIDADWQVSTANQFNPARAQVSVYGLAGAGQSLATAFAMHVDAMSYDTGSGENDASAPVTGKIGKSSDTVLGNMAHFLMRYYLNTGATAGGILQFDTVIAYAYTA